MFVPFHAGGIISQFEGYDDLKELDWEDYHARYGDISRLDRILEAENDTTNRYKVSKQADVLMLFYLLSAEELAALFAPPRLRMGSAQHPGNDRLLPGPHVQRLDPQHPGPRVGAGAGQPGPRR